MSEGHKSAKEIIEAVPDNLREVVIVGVDGDGRSYIAASSSALRTLFLLENASRRITTGQVDAVLTPKLRLT